MNKYEKENLIKKKNSIINNIQFQAVFMKMDIEEMKAKIVQRITESMKNCTCNTEEDIYKLMKENVNIVIDDYIENLETKMNEIIKNIEDEFLFRENKCEIEKRKRGRPKKFNVVDSARVILEYEKTNSVKSVVEKYKSMGKSISDRQVRNILEEAGVYKKKLTK